MLMMVKTHRQGGDFISLLFPLGRKENIKNQLHLSGLDRDSQVNNIRFNDREISEK
jgi:hypothetical protein